MDFSYPTYNPYRVLFLDDDPATPMLRGQDVYALQTALKELGTYTAVVDGIFGGLTRSAVVTAQKQLGITADGKAGPITQRTICVVLIAPLTEKHNFPNGLLYGQLSHESGMLLGNYSRPPRADGSYDAGVAQRNTALTDPKLGFDVIDSTEALSARVAEHFELFKGVPTRRRWKLAQGSWNAPAFACYLAKSEGAIRVTSSRLPRYTPSATTLATFEEYMRAVSVYTEL